MKPTFFASFLSLIALLASGCATNQRVDELEQKLARATTTLDSLQQARSRPWSPSPYWNYTWFDLGKQYHQITDRCFYVSNINTIFKENGFEVSGQIANLDALSKNNVKIQCAIKDSTVAGLLTFGFSEMPFLPSGVKLNFTVFVPTRQTKVSQIGVWVPEYRM